MTSRHIYRRTIILNKNTNNFPILKKKVLNKIDEIQGLYPYIRISYAPHKPDSTNNAINLNANVLMLQFNYEDFMKHNSGHISEEDNMMDLPDLGIEKTFDHINNQNAQIIQNALRNILSDANKYTTHEISDHNIRLMDNTMIYEITRDYYHNLAQTIMKRYNGIVEIFNVATSSAVIRIHWNIYLSYITSIRNRNRQVPLIIDPMNNFNIAPDTKIQNAYPPDINTFNKQSNLPQQQYDKDIKKKEHIKSKKKTVYTPEDFADFPDTPRDDLPAYEKPLYPPMAESI